MKPYLIKLLSRFALLSAAPILILAGCPDAGADNSSAGVALDMDISTRAYDQERISVQDIESSVCAATGETFWFALVAQNVQNLDTYEIEVSFDDSRLQFVAGMEDSSFNGIYNILKDNGGSTVGFQAVENQPGIVNVANALVGADENEAPEGSGILALLGFQALDEDYDNALSVSKANYIDHSGRIDEIAARLNASANPLLLLVAKTFQDCEEAADCYISCFNSIQEAVDYPLDNGVVVKILPGSYEAQVTVDTKVTLMIADGLVVLGNN